MSLLTNLSAYWKLDETSGTRYDETANNNDLTDNNTVGYEAGRVNTAADFNAGNSESLSIADNSHISLNGTSFSICFWAKVHRNGQQPLICKSARPYSIVAESANEFSIWQYRSRGQNKNWVITGSGNGFHSGHFLDIGNSQGDDRYGFGCFVHDNSAGTGIWYSGPVVDEDPTELFRFPDTPVTGSGMFPISATSNALRFGTSIATSHFLDGAIDEVGIWKRVLTETEVRLLYNYGNGTTYPFDDAGGSDMDWLSAGSLEALHRRHLTPDRTNPVFVQYDYSWPGFLNDKFQDVPDITDWGSPPEVPVLPREHRRAPYRFYSQEDTNIYPDVSDWWLQASEPVMPRKGTGERAYWESGQERDSASGEPSIPTTNPGVSSPSSATGGGDDTIIPPIAEPSIDGKAGLYIPERPDLEDTLRPRVDDPE